MQIKYLVKTIFINLLILLIINAISAEDIDPNTIPNLSPDELCKLDPNIIVKNFNLLTPEQKECLVSNQIGAVAEANPTSLGDLRQYNPDSINNMMRIKRGGIWDHVSYQGATLNKDGTISGGEIKDKQGNIIKNSQNLDKEGDFILGSFEFLAKAATELITYSNVDGTKIKFNIPQGASLTMINNDNSFETTSSPGVESEIISKCPGPLIYSALEQDSRLSITKNLNSIYEFSYGALEFDANGKKQLLRTERTSKAEIDPCQGFVCITLAPEAKFDNEEQLDSFYLENPETGKDYTFCLEKKEGDGYKTLNQFTLNGIINFMNYEKSKLYTGTDPDTTATFTIQDGVARNFKVENKKDSLVSYTFPSESFTIQEEKERYVIHEPLLTIDYTLDSYSSITFFNTPDMWVDKKILYQTAQKNSKVIFLPFAHPEIFIYLSKRNSEQYKTYLK